MQFQWIDNIINFLYIILVNLIYILFNINIIVFNITKFTQTTVQGYETQLASETVMNFVRNHIKNTFYI